MEHDYADCDTYLIMQLLQLFFTFLHCFCACSEFELLQKCRNETPHLYCIIKLDRVNRSARSDQPFQFVIIVHSSTLSKYYDFRHLQTTGNIIKHIQ